VPIVRTASGPGLPTNFPFSLAAAGRDVCFISGMPAVDRTGSYAGGSFLEEVHLAWQNVTAIAAAAGYSPSNIIYVQCVLADIADYGQLNEWWREQFPDPSAAPARFTFQAGALPFGAKVELQAVASGDD
jgi:2-iminobutanoate/2-iminopropanoate deaminase